MPEYKRRKRSEEVPLEEFKGLFDGRMGKDAMQILNMCKKDFTPKSMRPLLHHTIIFAYKFGQPKGQELRQVSFFLFSDGCIHVVCFGI